jgi:hypothetical protein
MSKLIKFIFLFHIYSYSLLNTNKPNKLCNLNNRVCYGLINKNKNLCSETKLFSTEASSALPLSSSDISTPNAYLREKVPIRKTFKKIFPLGAMLFFILFNYTILRDTKDVLVVTAPNSGAEIIPFLKTYVNLPSAIGFTLLYSQLCNKMSTDKVFYFVMTAFLFFFGSFAGIICKLLLVF